MHRYKSQVEVQAARIDDIIKTHAGIFLIPEDRGLGRIEVDRAFLASHQPTPGGYYVVKSDGSRQFIHASAFESEYTPI